jgi:hypothetical protein
VVNNNTRWPLPASPSAGLGVKLPRLPNASAALGDRMPNVTYGPRGREWVTKNDASFGLMNGRGSGGRQYIPGQIHRSDRMASTGLYDHGKT